MIEPSPPRLIEADDHTATLLRHASERYRAGLDATQALERATRPRARISRLLLLSAAVAALGLLVITSWRPREVLPAVVAEPLRAAPSPEAAAPVPPVPTPATTAPAGRVRPSPEPARAEVAPRMPSASAPSAPSSVAAVEPDCAKMAREGDAPSAAVCFTERANGSGLAAQVALYELSRLEQGALGRPAQALATLERYLQRFPNGSLTGEARFSRLELLTRLGRDGEALEASREFLSSSSGVERAAEVRLLRGNLYLRSGRAAAAVPEYRAALGGPGRVGDDAAYQLGVALEQSGDPARARAAYERYLERAGARHAGRARVRLSELTR